jgi:hypothetical protein
MASREDNRIYIRALASGQTIWSGVAAP